MLGEFEMDITSCKYLYEKISYKLINPKLVFFDPKWTDADSLVGRRARVEFKFDNENIADLVLYFHFGRHLFKKETIDIVRLQIATLGGYEYIDLKLDGQSEYDLYLTCQSINSLNTYLEYESLLKEFKSED